MSEIKKTETELAVTSGFVSTESIVYTTEFEKFRQECGFRIYMCRGADPHSKGKIENVVRYVKHGFVENRIYPYDDSTLNALAVAWLERTANAKIHGTTRRIPAEVFAEEREHLLPIPIIEDQGKAKLVRTVRKDNTVLYNGNRYSVPIGTYTHQKEVCLEIEGSILKIYTTTSDPICEHTISESKGLLIPSTARILNKFFTTILLASSGRSFRRIYIMFGIECAAIQPCIYFCT